MTKGITRVTLDVTATRRSVGMPPQRAGLFAKVPPRFATSTA